LDSLNNGQGISEKELKELYKNKNESDNTIKELTMLLEKLGDVLQNIKQR